MSNTREYNFKVTTIEAGQRAKYGDSYFHFEIENLSEIDYNVRVLMEFCTRFLRPANFNHQQIKDELAKPNASFGLHFAPYWTHFEKVEDRKFVYKMVEPSTH